MSAENRIVERIRRAFAADDRPPSDRGGCPSPDELWEASRARLEPSRAREIVRHIARCTGCAAEWRLGMSDAAGSARVELADTAPAPPRGRRAFRIAAVAAVAAGLALMLFVVDFDRTNQPSAFRSGEQLELHSLTPEEHALTRDACVLRWSSVGAGARYDLEVSRETLEPIVSERGLVGTEYTIAPQVLAVVPAGEPIVWRVEARLPDGRRVSSAAYIQPLD